MARKHVIFPGLSKKSFCLSENILKNIILCVVGMACACLMANMAKNSIFEPASHILQQLMDNLSEKGLSKIGVILYSFTANSKYALLLFFFSFTNVWKLYSRCFVFYIGFLQGVLLSCCLFLKGFSGIFFYLALLAPHSFLLAPVYLFLLQQLENWHGGTLYQECSSSCESGNIFPQKKKQIFLQILPLFFTTMLLLLLGAMMEGYLNVPLLCLFY